MADSSHVRSAEQALHILEAVHDDEPERSEDELSPDAMSRIRVAIEAAFEQTWARVRAEAAAEAPGPHRVPRRSFATWARDQLLARLAELQRLLGGDLQVAHRKLVELSDDELRTLLTDVEDALARNGREPQ